LQNDHSLREKLWTIVRALQKGLRENGFNIGHTESPVTPVMMDGGVIEATNLILDLRENYGIFCSVVIYPVIPKGHILLRLIPTSAHTMEDVERTINAFKACSSKLLAGGYKTEEFADISALKV
jgi:glycine C-acetyltransferase